MKCLAKSIRDEHGLFTDRTILRCNNLNCESVLSYLIELRLMYITTSWMEDNAIKTGLPLQGDALEHYRLAIPEVTNCVNQLCTRNEQNQEFVRRQRRLSLSARYGKEFTIPIAFKEFTIPIAFKENSILEHICKVVGAHVVKEGCQSLDTYRYETLTNYLLNYKRGLFIPKRAEDAVVQLFSQLELLDHKRYSSYVITLSQQVMDELQLNKHFADALTLVSLGYRQKFYRYKEYLFSVVPETILNIRYVECLTYKKGKPLRRYHPLGIHWIVTPLDDIYAPTVQLPLTPTEHDGEISVCYQLAHCIYMIDTAIENSFVCYSKEPNLT